MRYVDDFMVLADEQRADVEALRVEASVVLAPMAPCLSEPKTRICHDEGAIYLLSPARPAPATAKTYRQDDNLHRPVPCGRSRLLRTRRGRSHDG